MVATVAEEDPWQLVLISPSFDRESGCAAPPQEGSCALTLRAHRRSAESRIALNCRHVRACRRRTDRRRGLYTPSNARSRFCCPVPLAFLTPGAVGLDARRAHWAGSASRLL